MSYIPKPDDLVTNEVREAFFNLRTLCANADTDRELLLYMQRFAMAQNELRTLFSMVEQAALGKMRQFLTVSEMESTSSDLGFDLTEQTRKERTS